MRTKISALIASLLAFLTLGLVSATSASAAPIDCPPGQSAQKTDDGWQCVNKPGHDSNAEDPKNPNKDKGDF
ncbi:hypothetical protein [Georgenia sp. SUBG003]|uniref:hypothetical protein n=1 Tax=Georgenia sp. SUBG003 TaxID=1497974 RepID=UPI0004D5640D|nr:hypothetical protein DA06_16840 [Georgenia sp. SUBG003]